MSLHPKNAEALEEIDAMVFSGDSLQDGENHKLFMEYLGRWNRAMASHTFYDVEEEETDESS